jgi:RNA polymerase sigma-70 factor (ECF subfamily)
MDQEDRFLALLRAGDAHAFEILVQRYGGRMLAVARRFFPRGEDGADAVQDALLAAYQSVGSFGGK